MRIPALSLALVAVGALLAVPAPAQVRQEAELRFTTKEPAAPSGLRFSVDYVNPDDRDGKPPAVVQVRERLARGARFDTTVPALCTASDAELMLFGTAGCPPASQVGRGHLTLDTGLPAPLRILDVEVDFFNNTNEFIFLNQPLATDVPRVVTRARATTRTYTTDAPFLPGTPPDGAAVDTVDVRMPAITGGSGDEKRGYVTTPPRCPPRGYWVNRATFTYYDGVSQTVATKSRCSR